MSQLINLMTTGPEAVTHVFATEALRVVSRAIQQALRANVPVSLEGVGRLYTKECPARPGFNPRTRQPITIPPKRRVRFKQAPSLQLPPL